MMKLFWGFVLFICSSTSLFAQYRYPTKGEIFNDTLWIFNPSGFQFVDLTGSTPSAPSIYQNTMLDSVLAFTKSEHKLWFLVKNKILSYNGKSWTSYPFDTDSLARVSRFSALSDDTLFYSIEYTKYKTAARLHYAVVVRERAWVNGKSFVFEIPRKSTILTNSSGTSYDIKPYQIIKSTVDGKTQLILPENPVQKIQRAWLSPEGKLWIYQHKEGLSIIGDSLEKRIPFRFSKSEVDYTGNLLFLDSGVVAASFDEIAIYDGQQWFFESIPTCYFILGYKQFVLFVSKDGFGYKTFVK